MVNTPHLEVLTADGADVLEKLVTKESPSPTLLDPATTENIVLFASYSAAGFGLAYLNTPLSYYMIDELNCSAAQQAIVWTMIGLPWGFKFLLGLLSDAFPIAGLRRKPYFVLGWVTFIKSNAILALIGKPSVVVLVPLLFSMTCGLVLADVCVDALVVERSSTYGSHLQALGYSLRFMGGIAGAILGAISYSNPLLNLSIAQVFLLDAAVPLCAVAPALLLCGLEEQTRATVSLRDQLGALWTMVKLQAVYRPCAFIFAYNVLFLGNPAWNSFLVVSLGFTSFDIGVLSLTGAIFSYLALVVYKACMTDFNWRNVYVFTTVASFVFTAAQLLLIFDVSKHINQSHLQRLCFAIFTSGIVQFVTSVQFLPSCRMFLTMCPEGSEGASYAMLTTISNLANTVSSSLSAALASVWDVSNESLARHHYSGLWKLTILCGCSQLCGLLLVGLLPSSSRDQKYMQRYSGSSELGGSVFVAVQCLSLLFVVANAILTLALFSKS